MQHERALALAPAQSGGREDRVQVDFTRTWKNELGSEMTVVQTDQALVGKYVSPASGTNQTVEGPLVGWVDGQVISFTVNWTTLPSITTWAGHLVKGDRKDAIETLWQLALTMANPDDPLDLWESVFAGADRFTRVI